MIRRSHRLLRSAFPKNKEGLRLFSSSFTLVTGPSLKGGCAVVVSKAVSKKAVARNRIRRRVQSVLRSFFRANKYVVVYVKKEATDLTFLQLKEELSGALTKVLS